MKKHHLSYTLAIVAVLAMVIGLSLVWIDYHEGQTAKAATSTQAQGSLQ